MIKYLIKNRVVLIIEFHLEREYEMKIPRVSRLTIISPIDETYINKIDIKESEMIYRPKNH